VIKKKRIETKPKKYRHKNLVNGGSPMQFKHYCTHMQHKVENPKLNGNKNTSK
jgi:hypothetical protein